VSWFVVADEVEIGRDHIRSLQRPGYVCERARIVVPVVGVEAADSVARVQRKAQVQGVVHAAVSAWEYADSFGREACHDAEGVVGRSPVQDQQLLIGMGLTEERLERVADCSFRVQTWREDGDLHCLAPARAEAARTAAGGGAVVCSGT
jgi:hypothetical protein